MQYIYIADAMPININWYYWLLISNKKIKKSIPILQQDLKSIQTLSNYLEMMPMHSMA